MKARKRPYRSRRRVEIYFVLYLTALMLLLLDQRGTEINPDDDLVWQLLETNFSLQAEKNLLSCTMIQEEEGVRVVAIDSANTIFMQGNVSNISYDYDLKDLRRGESIRIGDAAGDAVDNFRSTPDSATGSSLFYWRPALDDLSSTLIKVSVTARATPTIPPRLTSLKHRRQLENIIKAGAQIEARTEFEISINFLPSNPIALNPINDDSLSANEGPATVIIQGPEVTINQSAPGALSLSPQRATIYAVPFAYWENRFFVGGIDLLSGLAEQPQLTVSGAADAEGLAEIVSVEQDHLLIRGRLPALGDMRVQVRIQREADGKIALSSFDVQPQDLQPPDLPARMYPGVEYLINPRFPALVGQETRAVLQEKGGRERYVSTQGQEFFFSPQEQDVGSDLLLLRFINGRKIDEQVQLRVQDFPAPEIAEIIPQGGQKVIVTTRAYGIRAGRNRVTLQITGNGQQARERHGEYEYQPDDYMHIQVFEVTPRDAGQAFTFGVRAANSKASSKERQWQGQ